MRTVELPLSGIRVLDLTRALAGPFCTAILADLGAEVVKVEPTPRGEMIRGWGPFKDGVSVYYLSINRNKRSLALDFRAPAAMPLLREMAGIADVVVENFKPGTMEEMGLGWEALSVANPRLVLTSISGFGRGGPYTDWPGLDQIAQGMSGLMSVTGSKGGEATRVGIPIGDVTAGMWAAIGTQAALFQRAVSGRGQRVETSLLAGLIGMLNVQAQRTLSLDDVPEPAGNDHPVICPYGTFQASDGAFNMAAVTDEMWAKLCRLLDLEALTSDPAFSDNTARMRNRDDLVRRLNERFASRPKAEWTRELVALGLPAGPILSMAEVFEDEHVRATGMVETVAHPRLGALRQLASPVRLEGMAGSGSVRTPPPELGEHSEAVLAEWGFDPERIAGLVADATIVNSGRS